MDEQVALRFMERFAGLDRAYGIYVLDNERSRRGKEKGRARTVNGAVNVAHWVEHLNGITGLGIVPIRDDATCVFGCIDVDVYDLDVEALAARVRAVQLPLTVARSKSGGAHLYVFMKEPTPCSIVRKALLDCTVILDFMGSEIFPKQENLASTNDVGNWLNMPYFDATHTTRYAIVDNDALTAEQFLDHADITAVTAEDLSRIEVPDDSLLEEGPPCLQALARNGIPEGGRNDAMFSFGVYARMKFTDVQDWQDELNVYNQQFMNPPLPYNEVAAISKQLQKKEYFYKCKNPPLCNYCNKEVCRTRRYGVGEGGGDDPGVMIDGLTEITTDPRTYIVIVNGIRIQMTSQELTSQARFGRCCIEKVRKWPTPIKLKPWKNLINKLLDESDVIEAPDDASPAGQLAYLLEQFCTTRAQARTRDEILMAKPWTDEDRTYFRGNDFYAYLRQQKFYDMSTREVYPTLRDRFDVTQKQFKIKGKNVRCWAVPAFIHQTESHEPARIPVGEF